VVQNEAKDASVENQYKKPEIRGVGMEGRWNAGGDKMEKSVAIKKKSRKGRVTVVLAGIAALILFRHFRESKRRAKNEEGD
jgi:hypothetical protein